MEARQGKIEMDRKKANQLIKGLEKFIKEFGSYKKLLMTNPLTQVQEGFKLLFMGATQEMRNFKAHNNIKQNDPYITLEHSGFACFLLKRIDYWKPGTI
ncbi:TIGR02391 family protein [Chloroflexota bacterium]